MIIGTGARSLPRARAYFEKFFAYLRKDLDMEVYETLSEESWAIPLVIPEIKILYRENLVFFAGEAAGFLNPFGEGISMALKSSISLANACIGELARPEIDHARLEKGYIENIGTDLAYMKSQWSLVKDLCPEFWENSTRLFM